jgi:hypothetical protein
VLRLVLPIPFMEHVLEHVLVVIRVRKLLILNSLDLLLLCSFSFDVWVSQLLAYVDGPTDPSIRA